MSETRSIPSPGSGASPQPPRVYPRLNRKLFILQWLALLGGLILLGGGAYDFYRSLQLGKVGRQVVGRLHEAKIEYTNRGRPIYKLTFDYTPEGSDTAYRKKFSVSEVQYHELARVGESPITYLPDDPEYSQVGAESRRNYESLAMGAAFLLIATAVAWFLHLQRNKVETFVTGDLAQDEPVQN
ncbi:MAG: hypothetical protein KF708_19575 [Pirellulales bacterium]|nr:hypothetical protein [Pirellulales bacterium]